MDNLPAIDQVTKRLCEISLSDFTNEFWNVIEPTTKYAHNWHVDAISEHLEAVSKGQIRKLIINMPPRLLKSTLVSVMWPCWTWTWKPSFQWLFGSYSANLAVRDSMKCRRIIESPKYIKYWGSKVKLMPDQNKKDEFALLATGHRICTGVGGSGTGKGADCIVVDDGNKAGDAFSEAKLKATVDWFDLEMSTRANDPQTGAFVVVMQRLSEKDLAGHLLKKGSYEHLILPMEYDSKGVKSRTSLGYVDPRTKDGQLLFPSRFGRKEVAAQKIDLGSMGFAAQMQQSPVPVSGNIVKREWFKFYRALPQLDYTIGSWDFTFKESKKSDYVVGGMIGVKGANRYIFPDLIREKMNFPAMLSAMKTYSTKHTGYRKIIVEAKANGEAIISSLKEEIYGIIPFYPADSKEARASAVAPQIEAGNVWLPDPITYPEAASWVDGFITEWIKFPKAEHDDQVDFLSQALLELKVGKNILTMSEDDLKKVQELYDAPRNISDLFKRR